MVLCDAGPEVPVPPQAWVPLLAKGSARLPALLVELGGAARATHGLPAKGGGGEHHDQHHGHHREAAGDGQQRRARGGDVEAGGVGAAGHGVRRRSRAMGRCRSPLCRDHLPPLARLQARSLTRSEEGNRLPPEGMG